jgi:ribosomal protein S18 acetylase RimI-like enzyme
MNLSSAFLTPSAPPPYPAQMVKPLTPKFLGFGDIPAFLALQSRVLDGLPPHQYHFLKPRTESDLKTHLDSGMPIIGIPDPSNPKKLLAQAILSYAKFEEALQNTQGYPFNPGDETVALLQSVAVDPAAKGLGLSKTLLDTALDVAAMRGMVVVIAKVSDDNKASKNLFLSAGFHAAVHGIDPARGHDVIYFKHHIGGCVAAYPKMA